MDERTSASWRTVTKPANPRALSKRFSGSVDRAPHGLIRTSVKANQVMSETEAPKKRLEDPFVAAWASQASISTQILRVLMQNTAPLDLGWAER